MNVGLANGCWVFPVEVFHKKVGVDVGQGFPTIMRIRKPFPSDQVLELIAPAS